MVVSDQVYVRIAFSVVKPLLCRFSRKLSQFDLHFYNLSMIFLFTWQTTEDSVLLDKVNKKVDQDMGGYVHPFSWLPGTPDSWVLCTEPHVEDTSL
jgi:hypothetical protein